MFSAGDYIGPYKLISKLGVGSFGVVWLAEKQTAITSIKVALKVPLTADIDLEAVKREANLWVQASGHPNVLPIIEADVYREQVVIASEYVPDGSLESWLKQHNGKAPSIETAVEIISNILAGLEHLHSQQIIHRDLKPGNILLQRGIPRLADFGLSRVLKSTSSMSTNVSGTPSYMAPEAFDGKRFEQTDLWAVGVIFYQLLSGRLPFPQTDMPSLIAGIITREPEPLPITVPQNLQHIINKALKKNPTERFESAAEMRQALRNQNWRSMESADIGNDYSLDKTIKMGAEETISTPLDLSDYKSTENSSKESEQKTQLSNAPALTFSLNTSWIKIGISLFSLVIVSFVAISVWSYLKFGKQVSDANNQIQSKQPLYEIDSSLKPKPVEVYPGAINSLPDSTKRYALVIGASKYDDSNILKDELTSIIKDSEVMKNALIDYMGFIKEQVTLINAKQSADLQPTRNNILKTLSRITKDIPKDSLLFIYYTGYGFQQQGQVYLMPSDAQLGSDKDFLLVSETAISVTSIIERIQKAGISQVMLLLDTSFRDPTNTTESKNLLAKEIYRGRFQLNSSNSKTTAYAVLHSASIGQDSYEYNEMDQGYMTWELLEGLKGAAADKNGFITLKGLLDYVHERVPMRVKLNTKKGIQNPWSLIEGYNPDEVIIRKVEPR